MFSATGTYRKQRRSVSWDDRNGFGGDAAVVAALRREARALDGEPLGPPEGPLVSGDYERDAFASLDLMTRVMDRIEFTGDVPTRSDEGY